jgi:eukaryotic-like serine/threonine-protein kinase
VRTYGARDRSPPRRESWSDTFVRVERALVGNRYELGPAIGSGGFGTVFRARDPQRRADVALKLVPPGFGSDVLAERLRREATILRRVASRHVAQILDFGEDEHGVWLVTELVDGVWLDRISLGRPLLPHEVLRVARGLLEGLAAVHAAGIIHGDVKASNVLVPRGQDALDAPKLIDFGLARVTSRMEIAEELGEAPPSVNRARGLVLGSARTMAPEVLLGRDPDQRADVYSAGLVLFELLDAGDLFPVGDGRDQLRARVTTDPMLDERVPPPLSMVLAKMLARDPAQRYVNAAQAHGAVVDLDTAPVSIVREEAPTSLRGHTLPTDAPLSTRTSSIPLRHSSHPSSLRPASSTRARSVPPLPRLTSLPPDGIAALRETLRHLDLPMLDALARRERGNAIGRIARAVALALRLELDAAALILEPLGLQSDVARAIGATVLAPRARRVTRARVDSDRDDKWADTIDVELAAMLASLAAAISAKDDAARDATRCARVLERLEAARGNETTRTTLRIALTAARVRKGELGSGAALDLVAPLLSQAESRSEPLHLVVRALCAAVLAGRADDLRAREELERAERIAAETGTTLLDACAATALGTLLVGAATRLDHGLAVLERAQTLLMHGDAPSLEHEAEHHRAAALVMTGRWAEAVGHLRAAREAAHAERAGELEIASASLEVVAHLAVGERAPAREAAATLGDARLSSASGRAAALAWVARSLDALAAGEIDASEDALTEAEARVREAGAETADAYVVVEVLGMLFDAARGALPDLMGPASDLERFAAEHNFTAFYWFDVLRAVVERVDDVNAARKMQDALNRLTTMLGPQSRLARERRTSAPPGAVL